MEKSIAAAKRFSPRASLATIGIKLQELKLFETLSQTVKVPQKRVNDCCFRATRWGHVRTSFRPALRGVS